MARDYKPKGGKRKAAGRSARKGSQGTKRSGGRARASRANTSAPGWQWLLAGLAMGLLVAAGVFVSDRMPGGVSTQLDERTERPAPASPTPQPAPPPAPASNEQPPQEESPREYAFYDLLPRFEVVIPEQETGLQQQGEEPAVVREPGTYILQVGSFASHDDADRMQATLALQGIESRIQIVTIDDASYHRVRIGPIDDLRELDSLREQLRGAAVEYLVIRVGSAG
ncbi:MAG: SPOR domain-containing protein [Pseudomonadota bacterium]